MPEKSSAPEAEAPNNAPAVLKGMHVASGSDLDASRAIRMVKLCDPRCDVCAPDQWVAPHNWWRDCPHDPYTHFELRDEVKTEYRTLENGERIVASKEVTQIERPWPNFRQVPATSRHGGLLVETGHIAKRKFQQFGWIPPEDIRSPAFPNGLAPFCQFRECFSQDIKRYVSGWFCQELEAILCYEDQTYVKPEVNLQTARDEQFAESTSRLRALSG